MKKYFFFSVLGLILLGACNDDRIDPNLEYYSPSDFYENHREEEQSFVIPTDDGSSPIIGKKGTELYGGRQIFEYLNGDSVGLPWVVKLIELYSIKDYILYQLPTVGNAIPLESGAIVKVTAFDSVGVPLKVKSGAFYEAKLATSPTIDSMQIYQGDSDTSFINWEVAADGSTMNIDANKKYDLQLATLGWQHAAQASFSASTTITYTIKGKGGENIDLWVIPTDKHALFYGKNLMTENIPIGESVRIIAFALNQDDDFVIFDTTVTVTENMEIPIKFDTIAEDAMLDLLSSL